MNILNNFKYLWVLVLVFNILIVKLAHADSVADQLKQLQSQIAALTKVVESQQQEIANLKAENVKVVAAQAAQPVAQDFSQAKSAPIVRGSDFNPEIGVVADIVGTLSESKDDLEGNDRFSVREAELVVGHDIDPYSRFDGVFTISDFENADVEEAYITHWGIPGLKAKVGRMRQRVTLASMAHRDTLETVDEPLVVQKYLGVEGLFRTGLELSSILPNAWDPLTQELIFGIMEGGVGEDGELFGETRRTPSYYGRLKNSFDLTDSSTFNLGSTFMLGSSDDDSSLEARALNIDFQLIHSFNSVQRFKLQSEFMFQDRSSPFVEDGAGDASNETLDKNPWGTYLLADYRFAQRWSSGTRIDYVEPTNHEDNLHNGDTAFSGYITFHQSEFARWRFQYEHVDFAQGDADNRFFLQSTVAIGQHKHALQ